MKKEEEDYITIVPATPPPKAVYHNVCVCIGA
jgi:hypothetical protein